MMSPKIMRSWRNIRSLIINTSYQKLPFRHHRKPGYCTPGVPAVRRSVHLFIAVVRGVCLCVHGMKNRDSQQEDQRVPTIVYDLDISYHFLYVILPQIHHMLVLNNTCSGGYTLLSVLHPNMLFFWRCVMILWW